MKGAVIHGARDVRFEERDEPRIIKPTDAIIRTSATCVCGSDLWPYRGIAAVAEPTPFGHEYCGIVEEVGSAVTKVKPGQFVIGSFFASDNTCPHCLAGYQTSCQHRELVGGAQAPRVRVPLADGTLVATPEVPSEDLIPSLLALSDVMGVPHDVALDGQELFFSHVRLHGGPAPVRRYLPQLIELTWERKLNPGKVFDLTLPLDQVAEGYRAMDERRAIKTLLRP
jgi:threonine dehydrogenase-like Zn-dependent dehydrogenase